MMRLRFHPGARAEFIDAMRYYEEQRPGYGDKFAAEVAGLAERIASWPESGALLPDFPAEYGVRAYAMKTFRYSLITATVAGEQVVYAVAHQHRRPGYWADRLR